MCLNLIFSTHDALKGQKMFLVFMSFEVVMKLVLHFHHFSPHLLCATLKLYSRVAVVGGEESKTSADYLHNHISHPRH